MTRFAEISRSAVEEILERIGRGWSQLQERRPLSYDLLEGDDAYLVVFDAPGAEHDDVQVQFVDREVEIRIDRFREYREGFEMRFPGRGLTLHGSAELPPDADVTHVGASATLTESGTLQVRIPKNESTTRVAVETEDGDEDPDEDA